MSSHKQKSADDASRPHGDAASTESNLTIPHQVLFDAQQFATEVAVELHTGFTFRGIISAVDDSFNVGLTDVVVTNARNPNFVRTHKSVTLRGSQILMVVLPETLADEFSTRAGKVVREMKKQKLRDKKDRQKRLLSKTQQRTPLAASPNMAAGGGGKEEKAVTSGGAVGGRSGANFQKLVSKKRPRSAS